MFVYLLNYCFVVETSLKINNYLIKQSWKFYLILSNCLNLLNWFQKKNWENYLANIHPSLKNPGKSPNYANRLNFFRFIAWKSAHQIFQLVII